MKQKINILVVEDNEYYNSLIFNALQQSTHFVERKMKYQLVLHSFVDSSDCIRKIESREFIDNDVIAFVDYNMGNGVSGAQIIRLLKKENCNTLAVLLLTHELWKKEAPRTTTIFLLLRTHLHLLFADFILINILKINFYSFGYY